MYNVTLSADGYKARYTIDGKHTIELTDWVPAFITGLKPGEHTITLELLDKDGNVVEGAFNKTERTFKVSLAEPAAS